MATLRIKNSANPAHPDVTHVRNTIPASPAASIDLNNLNARAPKVSINLRTTVWFVPLHAEAATQVLKIV
jgi:hypothetical protein